MTDTSNITINIAVGGRIINDARYKSFERYVDRVLSDITNSAQEYNNSDYNFSGEDIKLSLFSSPIVADIFWSDYAERKDLQLNVITPYDSYNDEAKSFLSKAHSITNINANRSYLAGSGSVISDWIADQIDLSVLLWDGSENNSDTWALIQACKRNDIPTLWIDINSPKDIYWISESYFDRYTNEKLKTYIEKLFSKTGSAFYPPEESKIPLWKLWNALYNRFMKKYKAKMQPVTYIDDKILDKDYANNVSGRSSDLIRVKIVNSFNKFDNNAIAYSQKYRTSIYLRSIMPFIVTIFLSIGFYTETILGYIYRVPGIDISPWAILAGIGFLIHGMLNFYIYRLSENSKVASWHLRFVDNRFIAEVLRLAAHFVPFGIPVNYNSSLNRFGNKIYKRLYVSNELRRITRNVETKSVTFDRFTADELFSNISNMIDDQIVYHDSSQNRYAAIVIKLKKLTTLLFIVGLTIVVLRGGLQFALVYIKTDISRNGINLIAFIKSFTNMLALIFPAWASYFSLKLSLSNFEGLMNNYTEMKNGLTVMKKILEDERKRPDISFERIYTFSKDLSKLMFGGVVDWYSKISSQKLTKL